MQKLFFKWTFFYCNILVEKIQHTMRLLLLLFCICCLSSCVKKGGKECEEKKSVDLTMETTRSSSLSSLIGKYKIIQLETKDNCLINKDSKVIKQKNNYFISSGNEIFKFDKEGKFIDKLSKKGNGPEDYSILEDFNIYNVNGNDEIWISNVQNIKKYDALTFNLKGIVNIKNQYIKKFERLDENRILIRTSGEYMFILCNSKGDIVDKYKEKDLANSAYKPIPFVNYENNILYQIDDTNFGVSYENGKFIEKEIVPLLENNLVTIEKNQEYYEKYGYLKQCEQINKDFSRIHTIQNKNNILLVITLHPDKVLLTIKKIDNQAETYKIYPTSPYLKNDILPTKNMNFLRTISACKSDDSFIFKIPISELTSFDNIKKYYNDNSCLSPIQEEDNMLLLEFY